MLTRDMMELEHSNVKWHVHSWKKFGNTLKIYIKYTYTISRNYTHENPWEMNGIDYAKIAPQMLTPISFITIKTKTN